MRRCVAIPLGLLLAACADDPVLTPSVPTNISRVGAEVGTPGWLLSDGLSVMVRDHRGAPLEGVTVEWSSVEAGAWFGAASSETNAEGVATVAFAPGWRVGNQLVRATADAHHDDVSVAVSTLQATQVAFAGTRACSIDEGGAVWCWSHEGNRNRFEPPTAIPSGFVPVVVDQQHRYREVVPGGIVTAEGHCGLTVTLELRCWNYLDDGIAPAPAQTINTPVSFVALARTPSGFSGVPGALCGLDAAGQAWCHGENTYGQLGDGTTALRNSFAPVAGGQRFAALAPGGSAFCGRDYDHHVWCWGSVNSPSLGDLVPVPTRMAGDLQFSDLGFTFWSACGIGLGDRQLYCWWGSDMEGIPAQGTQPGPVPGSAGLLRFVGSDNLGVYLWAGGDLGFSGFMGHEPGVFAWLTRPSVLPSDQNLPPTPGGFSAILSRGTEYWCAEHQGGATLCSYRANRVVGIPVPQ